MSTEKSDPAGRDGESRWVLQLLAEFAISSMCRHLRMKRVVIRRELQWGGGGEGGKGNKDADINFEKVRV